MMAPAARRREPPQPRRRPPRSQRLRRLLHAAELAISAAMVGGVAYAYMGYVDETERLKISQIIVEGAQRVPHGQIRQAAGLTEADSLFGFDPGGVARSVAALPAVRHCEVQRIYPDKVLIRVAERVPVATLLVHSQAYEIDEDGIVLRRLDNLETHAGPLISKTPGIGAVEHGQRIEQPELHAAIGAWRAFSLVPASQDIVLSEISAASLTDLRMYADNLPFELRWCAPDFEGQARRFDILWRHKQGVLPCTEYLDLRFDNDLACK